MQIVITLLSCMTHGNELLLSSLCGSLAIYVGTGTLRVTCILQNEDMWMLPKNFEAGAIFEELSSRLQATKDPVKRPQVSACLAHSHTTCSTLRGAMASLESTYEMCAQRYEPTALPASEVLSDSRQGSVAWAIVRTYWRRAALAAILLTSDTIMTLLEPLLLQRLLTAVRNSRPKGKLWVVRRSFCP